MGASFFMTIVNLIVLIFLFVLPGLNFLHYAPVADWWTNALVVAGAALAAFHLIFLRVNRHTISFAEIAIFLFFSVNAVIGYFIHINAGSINMLFACMVVLLVLSRFFHVQASLDKPQFILQVAKVIFLGGLLQTMLGFLQVFGLAPLLHGYVMFDMTSPTGNIMGNIAQRNLYGHYLAWAMFSACYLYSRRLLRLPFLFLAQFSFALLIAWSGGRLILGYVVAAVVWGMFWYVRSQRDEHMKKMVTALFLVFVTVIFTQLCLQQINEMLVWIGFKIDLQSGAERFFDSGFGMRRRIEWAKAWLLFKQHPLFGVGWDGYASAGNLLELQGGFPKVPESWLFTHCHNIVFQLLAETGLLGTGIFIVSLAILVLPFFVRKNANIDYLFLIVILSVTLIHSLFEFPLWYLSFSVMFVLVLSLSPLSDFDSDIRALIWRGMFGVFFVLCCTYVLIGVFRFNTLTRESMPTADIQVNKKRIEVLSDMRLDPFWTDDASFALARFLSPSRDHLAIKMDIYDGLLKYRPQPFILQNGAMLYALAGHKEKALELTKQFIVVYPDMVPQLCIAFSQQVDPAFIPLRKLADQACAISEQYPGAENDERRRLAIVNAFAAPVTRKALF